MEIFYFCEKIKIFAETLLYQWRDVGRRRRLTGRFAEVKS
jgi:hypothetical protein